MVFLMLVILVVIIFVLVNKWNNYEQSPQGSVSIVGKVVGIEHVDPAKTSVIKVDKDNKITINRLATIPVERVINVQFYKHTENRYIGSGLRKNYIYGELRILFKNKDDLESVISCHTRKGNEIEMMVSYENMKVSIERRLGIEQKKIVPPTEPYEL